MFIVGRRRWFQGAKSASLCTKVLVSGKCCRMQIFMAIGILQSPFALGIFLSTARLRGMIFQPNDFQFSKKLCLFDVIIENYQICEAFAQLFNKEEVKTFFAINLLSNNNK